MSKMLSSLAPVFDRLDEIAVMLKNRRLAVFLDYDGTLAPIVERPELAAISPSMHEAVSELSKHCTLAIISGRDLADIQKKIGLNDLIYAGSHGFEICGQAGIFFQHTRKAKFDTPLKKAAATIRDELASIDGLLVENKKLSIAVHYRQVDKADQPKVEKVVDSIIADNCGLRLKPGKMVYEIQPDIDWDKGKAVLHILDFLNLGGPDVIAVYVGDDITDEDAFKAIEGIGIGIFTGDTGHDRATAANYFVRDQNEVERLLRYLIDNRNT